MAVSTREQQDRLVSLRDAALLCGVSVDTLRRRIAASELPAVRCGRRIIRVRVSDLDSIFRPIPVGPPAPPSSGW